MPATWRAMRRIILVSVLIALGFVSAVAIGLGLDAGRFDIERQARIAAQAPAIYANLADLKRWNAWFPWLSNNHGGTLKYSGPAKGVGASCTWESRNQQDRSQLTVTQAQPNTSLHAQFEFEQLRTRDFTIDVTLTPDGDHTLTRLVVSGPHTVASRLFGKYTAQLGQDIEHALANLAKISQVAP